MIDLLPPVVATTPARPGGPVGGRPGAGGDAPADFATLLAALAGAVVTPTPDGAQDGAGVADVADVADGAGVADVAVIPEPGAVDGAAVEGTEPELLPADLDVQGAAALDATEGGAGDLPTGPGADRAEAPAGQGGRPAETGAAHRSERAPAPAGPNPATGTRTGDAGHPAAGPAAPAAPVAHARTSTAGAPVAQVGAPPVEPVRAGEQGARTAAPDARSSPAEPARPAAPTAPPPAGAAMAAAPAAPAAPSAAPTAPAPPVPLEQSVAEQVVTRVSALRLESGRSELSIDLHPVDLGRLRVELTLEDGALRVALRAESGATGDLLRRAMPELRAALEEAGLGVADLHVGPDHRPDAQHPGTPDGAGGDASSARAAGGGTAAAATGDDDAGPTDPTDRSGRHGLDLLL